MHRSRCTSPRKGKPGLNQDEEEKKFESSYLHDQDSSHKDDQDKEGEHLEGNIVNIIGKPVEDGNKHTHR